MGDYDCRHGWRDITYSLGSVLVSFAHLFDAQIVGWVKFRRCLSCWGIPVLHTRFGFLRRSSRAFCFGIPIVRPGKERDLGIFLFRPICCGLAASEKQDNRISAKQLARLTLRGVNSLL